MSIIMPKIVRFEIKTPSHKVVGSFSADEIDKARECIEGTNNYIHYIFKEIEEDATEH